MNMNDRIEAAKPYITGFIVGIIAAPIVAFSAGWVSTTSSRDMAVENARVEIFTNLCSARAGEAAAAGMIDLATLRGFSNRVRREELVTSVMADMQVPDSLVARVTTGCGRTFA